ncbi:MAG: GNAT family N-acetyltransferase [Pseudomonadota bacterium]
MPTAAQRIQPATLVRLRPATSDDWPMIRTWLRLPAIEAWWGPASICEGEVIAALQADAAMARIIEADGRPVGYAHAIDASLWGDELPHGLPVGTWDLDLFVADPELRGRGVGSEALSQLKSEVFATTLAVATCIFPSIANERAVRAFEKAGFAYKSVWQDPTHGPCWFMLCERNP